MSDNMCNRDYRDIDSGIEIDSADDSNDIRDDVNSTIMPGSIAEVYAAMSMRATEEAIRIGIAIGTETAERRIEEGRQEFAKGRYKRRLRNTRLLLANYRNLKDHVSGAIFTGKGAKENAIDILDRLEHFEYEEKYYIEAIKQSQQRTMIILSHIDSILELRRIVCEQSNKAEDLRRFKELYATYCDPDALTPQEICIAFGVELRTYYSDVSKAIKPLTTMIFGIDGLNIS